MSSQDTATRRTRTVSLRRARLNRAACAAAAVIALVSLAVLVLGFSAPAFLLIAPSLSAVLSAIRFIRWSRAIRIALTSPDEYRWTPDR